MDMKEQRFDFLKVESNGANTSVNKVYFTCHKSDVGYYREIANDVFKHANNNCLIYRKKETEAVISDEDIDFLYSMSLVVVPITAKLLLDTEDNIALREIKYAIDHNITVLPFMMELGLEMIYEASLFGKIQWVSSKIIGNDAVPYAEKLKNFFDKRFLKSETVQRIKDEFSARLFLSYRKKDRSYARPLMKQIHNQDGLSDVAIWYDEHLPLAEDYEVNINNEIDNSNAVVFLVTDNLTEPGNYVKNVEYPLAKDKEKAMLPVEPKNNADIRRRVKLDFEKLRAGFPEYVEVEEFPSKVDRNERDNTAEHKYLLGMAFLNGVDVEKDAERAILLLTEAANAEYLPAMVELSIIYRDGVGISRDHSVSVTWAEHYRKYAVEIFGEKTPEGIASECFIGDIHYNFGEYKRAFNSYINAYNSAENTFPVTDSLDFIRSKIISKLSVVCLKNGDHFKAAEFSNKLLGTWDKVDRYQDENDMVAVMSNLACALFENDQRDEAIELQIKLLSSCKELYGEDADITASVKMNLASFYAKSNNREHLMIARDLHKEVYSLFEKTYSDNHPHLLQAKLNVATVYGRLDNHVRALKMKKEVYDTCKAVYGANHLTLHALNNLAYSYGQIKGYERETLELRRESYRLHLDLMKADHPRALVACANYAYALMQNRHKKEAFELAKNNRLLCEKKLGKAHISTDTMNRIYNMFKGEF